MSIKGIDTLIDAVRLIRSDNFKTIVIGYGTAKYVNRIRLKIQRFKLRDKFLIIPGVEYVDVPKYLTIGDIFVLPTSHCEGLPFSIVEAFTYSLPVIASRIGGVPEIINDGVNGYLVPPRDTKALAEKTEAMRKNKQLRESLGLAGYDLVVDRFSIRTMVNMINDIFTRVVKESRGL